MKVSTKPEQDHIADITKRVYHRSCAGVAALALAKMEAIVTEQVISKNSAASVVTMTLVLSIGYAVLRYHIVGPVPWTDFPFFILNKGLAVRCLY